MPKKRPRGGGAAQEGRPDAAARRIRAVYVARRSAWEAQRRGVRYAWACPAAYDRATPPVTVDGVAVEGGKERPPVWVTLARRFAEAAVDPESYIHHVFEGLGPRRPPEPAQLLAEQYLEEFRRVRRLHGADVALALELQADTYAGHADYWQRAGMAALDARGFVLLDEHAALSALFRVCAAHALLGRAPVFTRIVKRYMRRAAVQFEQERAAYRRYWGAWLPRDFVRRSRRLYASALRSADLTGGWHGEEEE